jgi:hypothetical protein
MSAAFCHNPSFFRQCIGCCLSIIL